MYFPYWYADDETYVNATARGEKVRSWTVGDSRYTETQIYQVFREGDADIDNMIRGALSKEDAFLLKHVHPYDLSKIRDFSRFPSSVPSPFKMYSISYSGTAGLFFVKSLK